ncbi:MAG TPA: hypothetical protein VF707_20130 [Ardenticatenaceae bacterium]|jgi:cellobiose phosphorylase
MPRFQTDYSYFSDGGKEYVITRPDMPRPWVNVITGEAWDGETLPVAAGATQQVEAVVA